MAAVSSAHLRVNRGPTYTFVCVSRIPALEKVHFRHNICPTTAKTRLVIWFNSQLLLFIRVVLLKIHIFVLLTEVFCTDINTFLASS